ncbi:hypothetical protein QCN27_14630 [Cereibacter sp. SYSU M97828]|nr:hypothetical protein [Cereibacter flavus]
MAKAAGWFQHQPAGMGIHPVNAIVSAAMSSVSRTAHSCEQVPPGTAKGAYRSWAPYLRP